jgi:hypothetical protein
MVFLPILLSVDVILHIKTKPGINPVGSKLIIHVTVTQTLCSFRTIHIKCFIYVFLHDGIK